MNVLITGGAGFIGSNLCKHLLALDEVDEVRVIDDLSTGFKQNLEGLDVSFYEGTILDPDLLDECIPGVDSIVHLAAIPSVPRSIDNPIASHHANATGTLEVLEAARRHGLIHTIVASSSSVYGTNPAMPKSEDLRPMPVSPYAVSKLATESYALSYQQCYGLPALAFRFFNVYGPGQAAGHAYAAAIPIFIDHALRQAPIPIHGDGLQSRDFTYVGTVAEVLAAACSRKVASDTPENLAFGSNTTLMHVVEEIGTIMDRDLSTVHGPDRVGDVRHSSANSDRVRATFSQIVPVPLAEGLRATIEWATTAR